MPVKDSPKLRGPWTNSSQRGNAISQYNRTSSDAIRWGLVALASADGLLVSVSLLHLPAGAQTRSRDMEMLEHLLTHRACHGWEKTRGERPALTDDLVARTRLPSPRPAPRVWRRGVRPSTNLQVPVEHAAWVLSPRVVRGRRRNSGRIVGEERPSSSRTVTPTTACSRTVTRSTMCAMIARRCSGVVPSMMAAKGAAWAAADRIEHV